MFLDIKNSKHKHQRTYSSWWVAFLSDCIFFLLRGDLIRFQFQITSQAYGFSNAFYIIWSLKLQCGFLIWSNACSRVVSFSDLSARLSSRSSKPRWSDGSRGSTVSRTTRSSLLSRLTLRWIRRTLYINKMSYMVNVKQLKNSLICKYFSFCFFYSNINKKKIMKWS